MGKGVPHALSGRRPKNPVVRPSRTAPVSEEPKAAAPAPAPAAPAPAPAAPAPAPAAPLHLLDGSVADLKAALDSGEHDAFLGDLLKAESEGKNRKTAIDAIEDRM
jgi:hypothetical protein